MDIEISGKKFSNVQKINVLLGKNGSGKSTLLRHFEERKTSLPNFGLAKYITPERGGDLVYEGGIETNISRDPNWGDSVRRRNRFDSFRQMSVGEFRRLETLVLRKIEGDETIRRDLGFSFNSTLLQINALLDQVCLSRGEHAGFDIRRKQTDEICRPDALSSGESELISLAIEILAFGYSVETAKGRIGYLFLDEPDVHLHPDLQGRLMQLLIQTVTDRDIIVFVATHSTAILGGLSDFEHACVGFMKAGDSAISFVPIVESLRKILPVFGAHPLSNVFNSRPILLVEGEDDERIWQQAVRSSEGRINIWPLAAGDVQSLDEFEKQVSGIAAAVYDRPMAFSLRDRDGSPYEIDDVGIVQRARLRCRSAENLILTDNVLALLGTTWPSMSGSIELWLNNFPRHPQANAMGTFKKGKFDRLSGNVKELRNVLMMLAGSQKPWEVAVGQSIADLTRRPPVGGNNSLSFYLGPRIVEKLSLFRN